MLRRFFSGNEAPTATTTDNLNTVEKLFTLQDDRERCDQVLGQLIDSLPGDVRGYVVLGNVPGSYHFAAVHGYSPELLDLQVEHGPWREPNPRIISNIIQELFTPNDKETRSHLGDLGLREANAALVAPLTFEGQHCGALILHRHSKEPFVDEDVKRAVQWGRVLGGVIGLYGDRRQTLRSLIDFTRTFVEAMEAQDFSQLGHAQRVTSYALSIGRVQGLSRDELKSLYFAAMLHDIGKLGNLNLSDENEDHPARGANMLASSPLLAAAARGVRSHHERWDGTGFPDELATESIPLLGRIVALADTFDFLSSERGQALPMRDVEKALEARARHELDPKLVQTLINLLRQGKSTAELGKLEQEDLPF